MSDDDKHEKILLIDNHIYFYGNITSENVLKAIKYISELNNNKKKRKIEKSKYTLEEDKNSDLIYFHINSSGGSFLDGIALYDTIRLSEKKIYTIGEGSICSMASIILLAGYKRIITENSYILIHQIRDDYSNFTGIMTYNEIKDNYISTKKFMNTMKNIYKTKTNMPDKILNKLLKKDIWLTSKKCLELGFVDKII
jgi:ATP-dependent Clp endopeptidase proteolytic subunit ClpP